MLAQSMEDHSPITLTLFDPVEDKQIRGIVMKVDQHLKLIKLRDENGEDWEWIKIANLIRVRI